MNNVTNLKTTKRLMIMAAGTGGHIFPGLAIAQTMRARGWEVSWLGTTHGMEQDLVPKSGIPMDAIAFSGMRGKGLAHTIKGGFKMLASFFAIRRFIARRKPDVVMGMGGYVTVPGGLMARLKGVPLVLVNADAALPKSAGKPKHTCCASGTRVLFDNSSAASALTSTSGTPFSRAIRPPGTVT